MLVGFCFQRSVFFFCRIGGVLVSLFKLSRLALSVWDEMTRKFCDLKEEASGDWGVTLIFVLHRWDASVL